MMKKLVFVCTGNTCRSPMAEALAVEVVERKSLDIEVFSRGILVSFPSPANEKAIEVVKEYQLDLNNHAAKQFAVDEVDNETLILTMTDKHKQYILMQHPTLQDKVFTLKEYLGEAGDIADPYGMSTHDYASCMIEIKRLIDQLFEE